jgi:hypothetical protein
MDITVFENSIRNYLTTKYGVIYTAGITLNQVPDGDMTIYTCKLGLNNSDKPLAITGQYPDLDSFLLNIYKEIDARRFYTAEYFTLRNVEELSSTKPAQFEDPSCVPCISKTDTVGDIYLKVLEKLNPQLKNLQIEIDQLSQTLDILSTSINSGSGGTGFTEASVILDPISSAYEIGSNISVSITGNIHQNSDTEIVSASIDYGAGSIVIPNNFGVISTSNINVNATRTYMATVNVRRSAIIKALYSNVITANFVHPFFYGISDTILADVNLYSSLTKDISLLQDKSYVLNGTNKYLYILIPDEYPIPKTIKQNGLNVKYAFSSSVSSVSSIGLTNNWVQNYKVFRTIDKTTVNNQEFIIEF